NLCILMLILVPSLAFGADFGFDAFQVTDSGNGVQKYSINIQMLALMTALTLLPALILMMTSFTRVIIVLSILRQALGMPQTPSNQIIIGLSLFLTMFIMTPVYNEVHEKAIKPYSENKITQEQAIKAAAIPVKQFMYNQTRIEDLDLFLEIS